MIVDLGHPSGECDNCDDARRSTVNEHLTAAMSREELRLKIGNVRSLLQLYFENQAGKLYQGESQAIMSERWLRAALKITSDILGD